MVYVLKLMAFATSRRSFLTRMMSPVSMATSVPEPTAMPRSACASAGASLMPSPTMATFFPACWSFCISRALSSGRTSAI